MTDTSEVLPTKRFSCADISKSAFKPPPKNEDKSLPGKVTGKLRDAIEAMVWQGLPRDDAARAAGVTPKALYIALTKQHVKAHYLKELEVLRTSERARNIHRLCDIRDAADNMPAVQAIGMLERLSEPSKAGVGAGGQAPGFVIVIGQQFGAHGGGAPQVVVDVTPTPQVAVREDTE